MWLHEMSHAGLDIGDYYNSGIWGSVGSGRLDQLGWDKYIEGFMNDAQIRCASPNETSTHWIVPSAAKGPYQKLVVVPLSKNKVIVVESMRSAGYNYKLPKVNQGALVYTVDVSITAHGEGTDVYIPNSFTPNDDDRNDFFYPAFQCDYSYFLITIMDRWGNTVYTSNNIIGKWDGKFKGNVQEAGTYVWFAEGIDFKNRKIEKKGTIILIR